MPETDSEPCLATSPGSAILATYLIATFLGSRLYRTWVGPETCARAGGLTWLVAGVAGLLPLVTADPRLAMPPLVRLLLGVTPVCAAVGILTPMLIDRWSAGHRPIPRYSVAELVQRLPARAARDLIEWPIEPTVGGNFARLLGHETPLVALTSLAPGAPALADDRPFNLRRWVLVP